ncbi:YSIRK-type signal peptide-containing protein, partial [Streptococcus pseudopneumoniae]
MDFRKCNREKVFRYSIRKYHFGAASVAVAALMFLGARASVVQADTTVNATEVSLESSEPKSDPAAEGASEASNGSERSADQTSNSVQRTPVGSDRDASPSSNNGESSEGSDRSNSSAVSGSDRSAEETSNSGQHAPVRRARSVGEDRASRLNGDYSYNVDQVPVPDEIFNTPIKLYDYWGQGMYNWLTQNSKPGIFELYYDDITESNKVRRKVPKSGRKIDQLYKDEAIDNLQTFDVFRHHPTATHLTLQFDVKTGNVNMKVIDSNNQVLRTILVPKTDIFMKQSEWEVKKKERERQEAETGPAKTAAKAALAEAVEAEKAEINADKSLTKEAKAEKLKELEAKQREEEAKIDSAEDADAVATAKTEGVTAVEGVHTPGNLEDVKTAAKAALAEAVEAEKAEINADKSL